MLAKKIGTVYTTDIHGSIKEMITVAMLYTEKRRARVLADLAIQPNERGFIPPDEFAKVLTWRALAEYKVKHEYPPAAVLRFVERGDLKIAEAKGPRRRLYRSEDAFTVAIFPRRGLRADSDSEQQQTRSSMSEIKVRGQYDHDTRRASPA